MRYEERREGVFDNELGRLITRLDVDAWRDYMAWLALPGNMPDPMPPGTDRNIEEENRIARIRRAILFLERSQARPLRELAIGTEEQKAAAVAKLREIEQAIRNQRALLSAPEREKPR